MFHTTQLVFEKGRRKTIALPDTIDCRTIEFLRYRRNPNSVFFF